MKLFSVKHRITFGLVIILMSTALLVTFSGYGPDSRQATLQGRKKLCESIAINTSVLLSQDDLARMEKILDAMVSRDDDLLSAGIRRADGQMVATIGNHNQTWVTDSKQSTESQVQVPLWSDDSRWGTVELCFSPITKTGLKGFVESPWTLYLALIGVITFVLYSIYLGKVLRQLDPSKAIPKRVRSALDALAEGLLVTDRKGRIVLANEAFSRWAGKDADKLIGRKASSFPWHSAEDNKELETFPWVRAIEEQVPQAQFLLGLSEESGKQLTLVANSSPVLGHDGEYRGVLTSFEDVTELEQHKEALLNAKQAADKANMAKSDFLARMSHEIRTPMNAILGYTEVLRRGFAESEFQRGEYLDTIHNSGEHLLALINDILDLSKVESGRLELELAQHSPHSIISQIISVFHGKAEEKGLRLRYEAKSKLPETILTDSVRLRQAIMNLVGNAIKFTEKGSVVVAARLIQEPKTLIAIDVADTGIGMSEEAMEKIFDPFAQGDTTITRRFGGTGLGLSITKQLAEMMGGEVSVASEPGKGTTFTITIDPGSLDDVQLVDFKESESRAGHAEACERQIKLPPSKILVVDDGAENRQLVALFLGRAGLTIETAENGKVAVDMVTKTDFDAVLMDMQMPVMDGFTATKRIRELGYDTPIIALTANVMKHDEGMCREAGFSGFLAKPINMDRLIGELSRVLDPDHSYSASTQEGGNDNSERQESEPIKQSVVTNDSVSVEKQSAISSLPETSNQQQTADSSPLVSKLPIDDPEFYEIVSGFVERLKERVVLMIGAAKRQDYKELADLAHWLKGAAGGCGFNEFTIPARELQSSAESNDQQGMASNLGIVVDLVKRIHLDPEPPTPSDGKRLLEKQSNAIHDAESTENVEPSTPIFSTLPTDDPEFRAIVDGFVERLNDRILEMRQTVANHEYGELANIAHWLKGAGGSMGFEPLVSPAGELQSCAKSGNIEEIEGLLSSIENIVGRIQQAQTAQSFECYAD